MQMPKNKKQRYSRFIILILIPISISFLSSGCQQDAASNQSGVKALPYLTQEGKTMGTYYRVTYSDAEERNFQDAIDSLLEVINLEVSTYIETSTISRFNQSDQPFDLSYNPGVTTEGDYKNPHFLANYQAAKDIYQKTEGYFDPTVMPLVNYWGFGYSEKKKITTVDSVKVDSLIQLVGFNKVHLRNNTISKSQAGVQLDFSALAKGYGVDMVAELLESQSVENYLVDIGGEVKAQGVNAKGSIWRIGINVPREGASMSAIQTAILLQNRALATSGNYRNFYEVDGVKYSHTISPATGYPERNTLLSASVFAKDCTTADAYATAFMVMGMDKAMEMASAIDGVEAYFIYSTSTGEMDVKYTEGLDQLFN
jgi:thiamine biosynthesis lipoprotein